MKQLPRECATGCVISKDGTTIGYRQLGQGPALTLVHGGMMSSANLMALAAALADSFTVYVPDRRGRGLSGPFGEHFGIGNAVEDLQAVIAESASERVFGLSVGAIVALYAALRTPAIRELVVYEPPFALSSVPGSSPSAWLPRYDRELGQGKLAEAMVTASKGIRAAPIFSALPRFVSVPLMQLALPAEARQARAGDTPLRDLIPTLQHDARIVLETADQLDPLKAIQARVFLLCGARSPAYFKRILAAVHVTLPSSTRVELPGLGHMSADNDGKPERVARELLRCFSGGTPAG